MCGMDLDPFGFILILRQSRFWREQTQRTEQRQYHADMRRELKRPANKALAVSHDGSDQLSRNASMPTSGRDTGLSETISALAEVRIATSRYPVHDMRSRDSPERQSFFARWLTWPAPRAHVTLSSVTAPTTSRLPWIDWMRGLACVLMFQTHCYDAWLGGDARNSNFLKRSQLLGTLPAPLFLFLAGASFALVTDKLIRKNASPTEITLRMARHGAEIFVFGLLFRLQEFVIAWGWAPWSDLLRVDVLNIIGLSMILMAVTCGVTLTFCEGARPSYRTPAANDSAQDMPSGTRLPAKNGSDCSRSGIAIAAVSIAVASLIALLTPPLYTTLRPTWMPWPLESYIDGCHNLGVPQPWLFPLFPL